MRDADCKLAKAPFNFLFYEGGDSLSESAGARPKAVPAVCIADVIPMAVRKSCAGA